MMIGGIVRQAFPAAILLLLLSAAWAQDQAAPIKLEIGGAHPRAVEDLTRAALARDYTQAWSNLVQALVSASDSSLGGYFVGGARGDLEAAVSGEQSTGVRQNLRLQSHQVTFVFYAPEGDLVELQDTVTGELQIHDGEKLIHQQQFVKHYIVLMTPAADRWVIRELQSVPHF
jgi:hypothetical protein